MKDPAFLFYSSDFLTGTMFMTDEQVGKYIRLMCAQHQKGRLTEKDMLHICKSYDEDIWNKFTKDQDGKFYSERLEAEIEKRKKYSESRRNNRLKPKKDKNTSLTHEKHMSPHMENENENEIKDVIEDVIEDKDESFETFWALYAKKVDRKATERAWKRIKKSLHDTIFAHVRDYVASTPDLKFRKNPASYLNANAWENEIITPFDGQTTPLTEELRPMDYTKGFGDV